MKTTVLPSGSAVPIVEIKPVGVEKHFWSDKFYVELEFKIGATRSAVERVSHQQAVAEQQGLIEAIQLAYDEVEPFDHGYEMAHAAGHGAGRSSGLEEGKTEGYQQGYSDGRSEGFEQGQSCGYDFGLWQGAIKAQRTNELAFWGRSLTCEKPGYVSSAGANWWNLPASLFWARYIRAD